MKIQSIGEIGTGDSGNKGNFGLIGQFLRLRNCPVAMETARWLRSKENELCVSFRIYCIYLWKYYFRDVQEKE